MFFGKDSLKSIETGKNIARYMRIGNNKEKKSNIKYREKGKKMENKESGNKNRKSRKMEKLFENKLK